MLFCRLNQALSWITWQMYSCSSLSFPSLCNIFVCVSVVIDRMISYEWSSSFQWILKSIFALSAHRLLWCQLPTPYTLTHTLLLSWGNYFMMHILIFLISLFCVLQNCELWYHCYYGRCMLNWWFLPPIIIECRYVSFFKNSSAIHSLSTG